MKKQKLTKEEQETRYARRKPLFYWIGILAVTMLTILPVLYKQAQIVAEVEPEMISGSPMSFAISSMIQPFLLGVGALAAGHMLAHQLGLKSDLYTLVLTPFTDEEKREWFALKKPILIRSAVIGAVVALLLVIYDAAFQSQLPEILQTASDSISPSNILSNIFYQGIVEEILLRWGLMSISIYVFSGQGENQEDWVYIAGIVFVVVLFALTRYRSLMVTAGGMTPVLWGRLVVQSILSLIHI